MMNFAQGAGQQTGNDLIPNGQLVWVIFQFRGLKASVAGGQYLDVEMTIDEGQPYGRKKIWDKIGDPMFAGNSDAYRQMGQIALARILEAGRNAGPNNPAGYQLANYEQLNGLRVPIKIGIEKGTDGYDDKNKVADYLTPNPTSVSGNKGYLALMAGQTNMTAAKPAASGGTSGFGAGAVNTSGGGGGFGGAGTTGFPQAQPQANNSGFATAGSQEQQAQSSATTASPSNAENPGGWLQQANG